MCCAPTSHETGRSAVYPMLHLIARGGVSSNDDIIQLDRHGIPSVVFGKAFYEGKIDINQLLRTWD